MRALLILFLLFASHLSVGATDLKPCELVVPCAVGDRSFHARLPDNWGRENALAGPAAFSRLGPTGPFDHETFADRRGDEKTGGAAARPQWPWPNLEFLECPTPVTCPCALSVIEEAARRWPIDRSKIFVSGYSYGSAMAWRFACSQGQSIKHAVGGVGINSRSNGRLFQPGEHSPCPTARAITLWTILSGPVVRSKALFAYGARGNGCDVQPDSQERWQAVKILSFHRHRWETCASGKSIVLDVHKRGHFIPRYWIERQLKELL